jgi:hypothetical protein
VACFPMPRSRSKMAEVISFLKQDVVHGNWKPTDLFLAFP